MVSRKTQYLWMAVGGVLCLLGVVLTMKLRDGTRAAAQDDPQETKLAAARHLPPEPPPGDPSVEKQAPADKEDTSRPPVVLIPGPVEPPAPTVSTPPVTAPPPAEDKSKDSVLPPALEPVREKGNSLPPLPPKGAPLPPLPSGPAATIPPPAAAPDLAPPAVASPAPPTGEPPTPQITQGGFHPEPSIKAPPPPKPEPKDDLQPVILNAPAPASIVLPEPPAKPAAPVEATWNKPEGTPQPPPPTAVAAAPAPIAKPMPPASAEPPLAPDTKGPLQTYRVKHAGETMRDIARRTLGSADRWSDVHRLNPALKPEETLASNTLVKLPPDACLPAEDSEAVRPLPVMRPQAPPAKPKELSPLTGTYLGNLDDKQAMTLPKALREQLGNCETVLVSPGPDQCLWLTNQAHLDHLADRLEHSPAREADVRVFKRLYYAQTEKSGVDAEGRVTVPDRLAQFAGLHQEVVLVGVDDHFELWDAARWRQYTQEKGGTARAASAE